MCVPGDGEGSVRENRGEGLQGARGNVSYLNCGDNLMGPVSKHIKLCTLNTCLLWYVSYTSVKLLKKQTNKNRKSLIDLWDNIESPNLYVIVVTEEK